MTSELKPAAHVLSEYWYYLGVYSYGEEYCAEDQELLEHMEAVDAENEALKQRIAELEKALQEIAEESDSGRYDGLPEPCPAHDAHTMWAIARGVLTKGENK